MNDWTQPLLAHVLDGSLDAHLLVKYAHKYGRDFILNAVKVIEFADLIKIYK